MITIKIGSTEFEAVPVYENIDKGVLQLSKVIWVPEGTVPAPLAGYLLKPLEKVQLNEEVVEL